MSTCRECSFTKCTDGKWYLELGNFEHAYESHDCTTYGPFDTLEEANGELEFHSNPGGSSTDDSGVADPPPAEELTKPTAKSRTGGLYGFRL